MHVRNMRLSLFRSPVVTIIRVTYNNITNSNKFVKPLSFYNEYLILIIQTLNSSFDYH